MWHYWTIIALTCSSLVAKAQYKLDHNCAVNRQIALNKAALPVPDAGIQFVPDCSPSGIDYYPLQCLAWDFCACSSAEGRMLTNWTRGLKGCDCLVAQDKARQVGSFVPQCDSVDRFTELQCNEQNGRCWRVDPQTGLVIRQKKRFPTHHGLPPPPAAAPKPHDLADLLRKREIANHNRIEPLRVEPVRVAPARVEPARVEPARIETGKVEPVRFEPAGVEPARSEIVRIEPPRVESVRHEPVKVEPVRIEAGGLEPGRSEFARPELVRNEPNEGQRETMSPIEMYRPSVHVILSNGTVVGTAIPVNGTLVILREGDLEKFVDSRAGKCVSPRDIEQSSLRVPQELNVVATERLNEAIGDFSIRLLKKNLGYDANVNSIFSASSISSALGMCLLGAQGETQKQPLGFDEISVEDIKRGYEQSSSSISVKTGAESRDGYIISQANREQVAASKRGLPSERHLKWKTSSTLDGFRGVWQKQMKKVNLSPLFRRSSQDLESEPVELTMPQFRVETVFDLGSTLAGLCMPLAFATDAGFGNIHSDQVQGRGVRISKIVHKATITIDEKGTDSAAATAAAVRLISAANAPSKTIIIDRPSLCLIVPEENRSRLPLYTSIVRELRMRPGTMKDVGLQLLVNHRKYPRFRLSQYLLC
ncbi:uncharacterized protein LOC100907269 [Galendromus occidentalis]|uniref:Uncharacterized protein LOC100907269 n=1 Tax=Galendromus occidentalis TaxID=34638 RepID=A0AAJ6VWJ6_9ACAR|nr:uncharacterized protein LOC100907269 [Galendromus occidentalis]